MKHPFIAGNWKSNKTTSEAADWLKEFTAIPDGATVVICVPFTVLPTFHWAVHSSHLPFLLGAQNISPFGDGAYTGEVNARQVKELADWVIVGHSERRNYFQETDEMLGKKVGLAKGVGLKVIYCVPDDKALVPDGVDVVAYEPVWAIGTGKTDTPENANAVIRSIKSKTKVSVCIYGGSVTPENVKQFMMTDSIDGVLPGGASLDPQKFALLIRNAVG